MKPFKAVFLIACLAAAPAFAIDASIIQKDQAFAQPIVTVSAGDTVRWGDADDINHNISIHLPSGSDVDLGLQVHGAIIQHKFEVAGVYHVFCKIHPRMKMVVVVQ